MPEIYAASRWSCWPVLLVFSSAEGLSLQACFLYHPCSSTCPTVTPCVACFIYSSAASDGLCLRILRCEWPPRCTCFSPRHSYAASLRQPCLTDMHVYPDVVPDSALPRRQQKHRLPCDGLFSFPICDSISLLFPWTARKVVIWSSGPPSFPQLPLSRRHPDLFICHLSQILDQGLVNYSTPIHLSLFP